MGSGFGLRFALGSWLSSVVFGPPGRAPTNAPSHNAYVTNCFPPLADRWPGVQLYRQHSFIRSPSCTMADASPYTKTSGAPSRSAPARLPMPRHLLLRRPPNTRADFLQQLLTSGEAPLLAQEARRKKTATSTR
jgi:hypothetical protein